MKVLAVTVVLAVVTPATIASAKFAREQGVASSTRTTALTTNERLRIVGEIIRQDRAVLHWWLHHHRNTPGERLHRCPAIGVRTSGPVCRIGQLLVDALHVARRLHATVVRQQRLLAQRAHRHAAATVASRHYQGWQCIHSREAGAWNTNTGNGYYGGLQMTAGWGGLSRPDLVSESVQIATAEREAAAHGFSYGWMAEQWRNTYPPCAGYFT